MLKEKMVNTNLPLSWLSFFEACFKWRRETEVIRMGRRFYDPPGLELRRKCNT